MKRIALILLALVIVAASVLPSAAFADGSDGEEYQARTPLNSSSSNKIYNIKLAAAELDGVYVAYGEEFSFNDTIGPRTEANGYRVAVNARGAKVRGGGVAQLATTLDKALNQIGGFEFTSRQVYGSLFTDDYVNDGYSAIITDYSAKTDYSFVNTVGDLMINAWVSSSNVYVSITLYDDQGGDTSPSLLGYASTPLGSSSALRSNISLASDTIDGTVLSYSDSFSFNDTVGPRTVKRGYGTAVNGRGAKVTGGGVAQVASTLYLALKDLGGDVNFLEKSTYGSKYNQSYVSSSADAILTDYNAGTDFRFRYLGDDTITIYMYISGDELICEIYSDGAPDPDEWF